MTRSLFFALLLTASLLAATPALAQSRNAAFLDPASSSSSSSSGPGGKGAQTSNTVVADPPQTDAGETLVNVARRVTVFFFNGVRGNVNLNELTINADGNVRSKVLSDDCKAIKTLPPQARCSVVMEIVPSSPGPWSVELLLNHSGMGRITRAEVVGSTLGKTDEKSEGLAVSKKIAAPMDFGKLMAGEESAARTMLIENDSTEPLKISAIDLIAHDEQGLSLRDAGCQKGDELKPGESCPITILWSPGSRGNIATDLIVRHSGNLGFVVVPIRGAAASDDKSGSVRTASNLGSSSGFNTSKGPKLIPSTGVPSIPSPPPIDELAKALPTLDSNQLSQPKPEEKKPATTKTAKSKPAKGEKKEAAAEDAAEVEIPNITLIGTVNGRAILGNDNYETFVVALGESTQVGEANVSLLQLDSTRAVINVAGVRKELRLRQAPTILKIKSSSDLNLSSGSSLGGPSDSVLNAKQKEKEKASDAATGGAPPPPANTGTGDQPATPGSPGMGLDAPTTPPPPT